MRAHKEEALESHKSFTEKDSNIFCDSLCFISSIGVRIQNPAYRSVLNETRFEECYNLLGAVVSLLERYNR